MTHKRGVSAREIMEDLRTGLTNEQFMEKYLLTPKGLSGIFRKLIAARLVACEELSGRTDLLCDSGEIEFRREPRYHPKEGIVICDLHDMTCDFGVVDLSRSGFQAEGLEAAIDEEKTFLMSVPGVEDLVPLSFRPRCRWVEPNPQYGIPKAGFEITDIEDDARTGLLKLLARTTSFD